MKKAVSGIILVLLFTSVLNVAFQVKPAMAESAGSYISVPYHRQITNYYCGPASLEMVFDFYGPDIPQIEIADVARTSYMYGGTFTDDMRRAVACMHACINLRSTCSAKTPLRCYCSKLTN